MKFPIIVILLMLSPNIAPAQTSAKSSEPSDVIVLQKSWRREIHQPSMEADPFEANNRHRDQVIAQNDADRQNSRRADQTVAVRPREQPINVSKPLPSDTSVFYAYRVKLRNTGTKTIKALAWAYIFFDVSGKEMGRHQYTSKVKINPSKSVEVIEWSYSPPSQIVDAKKAGKDSREALAEKIVINRIEYGDGSAWESHPQ
jgi:hypothetical protein